MNVKKDFNIPENSTYDWNVAMENMALLRTKSKITQTDLANALGYGMSAVSFYEKGRHFPRIDYVISFCYYFGISIDDLFNPDLIKELNVKW